MAEPTTTVPLAFTPLAPLELPPGKKPRPWKKHWGREVAGVAVAKAATETKTRSRLFFHDGESVACMIPSLPRARRRDRTGVSAKLIGTANKRCRFLRMIEGCRRPATEEKRKVRTPPSFGQCSGRAYAYTCGLPAYSADFGFCASTAAVLETGRNVLLTQEKP